MPLQNPPTNCDNHSASNTDDQESADAFQYDPDEVLDLSPIESDDSDCLDSLDDDEATTATLFVETSSAIVVTPTTRALAPIKYQRTEDDEATLETVESVAELHRPKERISPNYLEQFKAHNAASKERQRQRQRLRQVESISDAKDRIKATKRAAKAVATAIRRRERDAEDKRSKRASPGVLRTKRLLGLSKLTAAPKASKFAVKLRGREEEIVSFKDAMILCEKRDRVPDKRLGEVFYLLTGTEMDKRSAQRHRQIVEKLEASGGIWCRLA